MLPEILRSYGRQVLDDLDVQAVVGALKGQYLTGGPCVPEFESALQEYAGAKYAVSCGNCTQALHLSARGLGIGSRHSVIVPSITFLATANAPHSTGAEIVFSDVDPASGLMTAKNLEDALKRCTLEPYAVFPVHFAGQTVDIKSIHDLARQHGLKIVEDAAHAIGTVYQVEGKSYQVGDCAFSDAVTFSFHPVKHITTIEGGAVMMNDDAFANHVARLRAHGMVRDPQSFLNRDMAFDDEGLVNPWYYEMPDYGYNYRLTDVQAALGLSQLRKLPGFITSRMAIKCLYDELLSPYAPHIRLLKNTEGCQAAWHIYPVLIDFEALNKSRGNVMRRLAAAGIGTQVHYIPVHKQPYYRNLYGDLDLPGADSYYARTLTLPIHALMEESHVPLVVEKLVELLDL
ncbi:MAG: UDP-4-amino-4,6-dideoxy-N-acetyl-beta-L-altrosamine transaminase [Micavibrio sp.]